MQESVMQGCQWSGVSGPAYRAVDKSRLDEVGGDRVLASAQHQAQLPKQLPREDTLQQGTRHAGHKTCRCHEARHKAVTTDLLL